MMVRAPLFTYNALEALRALIRLDFENRLKASLLETNANPSPEAFQKQVKMVHNFVEHQEPLSVAMAILEIRSDDEILMPLADFRFNYYQSIVNDLSIDREKDFPNIPEDRFNEDIGPLIEAQQELKEIFAEAEYIERSDIDIEDEPEQSPPPQTPKGGSNKALLN